MSLAQSIKEIHVNIRHLMLIASLASPALLVGSGEKKPTGPADGEVLSPKKAFDNCVIILKTPMCIGPLLAMILNLILPETDLHDDDEEETKKPAPQPEPEASA